MNQKAINIINWLADSSDYFKGISVLQQNGKPSRGIMQTITRKENPYNREKLTYLLIKDLNGLLGSNEFTQQNYKAKAYDCIEKNGGIKKSIDSDLQPIKENTTESGLIENIKSGIKSFFSKKVSDKEYAKWFHQQPEKIQGLIKEQSRLTRERAKLHKDCREIKGNSQDAVLKRQPILNSIDEITEQIKSIYEIVENFKASGEISVQENNKPAENKDELDFSHLSDLQKKNELDNLKISIRRNRISLKKKKDKKSNAAIKLKNLIALKEKQIKILEDWYAGTKR